MPDRPAWTEDVIVVTGYARTGTTLIQGLLCASPDVMPVSAEAVMLRDLLIAYARAKELWQDYTRHYFADMAELRDFTRGSAGTWLAHVRGCFATEKRLLQKVPQAGAAYLPELAELLPNARFVVMLRDLRDVMVSQSERVRLVERRLDPAGEIRAFIRIYAKLTGAKPLAGRLAFVPYERLVGEPVATVERLAAFLTIEPPRDVASLEWRHMRTQELTTWSPLDGRPVTPERVARHRIQASSPAIAMVERRRDEIEKQIGLPVFVESGRPPAPMTFL